MATPRPAEGASELHGRLPVIDIHAHPSMKTYLFGHRLDRPHRPGGAFNPLAMRVDLPSLVDGGVNAVVSAIYLPERDLLPDCFPLRIVAFLAPRHWKRLLDPDRFQRTLDMLDDFETAVRDAGPVDGIELSVARSKDDLWEILDAGNLAVLHSVEGGHSLGGSADNVAVLFERGVCMITLVHFYENPLAYPVDGVPPGMKFLGCFRSPKELDRGLGPLGPPVIEEMVRLGVLVDMTHCTPVARGQVLDVVQGRAPVVMSHVGVAALKESPMNPTDEEIGAIADSGGVVGVIAMNHWLSDGEERDGIDLMVSTIEHLRRVGGTDVVALGSDFDGFTDPPDDLSEPSDLPALTGALVAAGYGEAEIEKFLGGNFLRTLRDGWGR